MPLRWGLQIKELLWNGCHVNLIYLMGLALKHSMPFIRETKLFHVVDNNSSSSPKEYLSWITTSMEGSERRDVSHVQGGGLSVGMSSWIVHVETVTHVYERTKYINLCDKSLHRIRNARLPTQKSILLYHRTELTAFQKGQIMETRGVGKSPTEIGEELNIPQTKVLGFLQWFQQYGSEENLSHTGRPWKTSAWFDCYVTRTAESSMHIPFAELHDITNSEVSVWTLHRRLGQEHIWKWRAVKQALLTDKHAKMHLKWAMEHRASTWEDWERILFRRMYCLKG